MTNPLRRAPHPPLAGPFAAPPSPDGIKPSAAVKNLVSTQVAALLESSPAFHELPPAKREEMRANLEKIAGYSAALIQDEWASAKKLGQTPVLREQTTILTPQEDEPSRSPSRPQAFGLGRALEEQPSPAAEEFSPRAANQVARITRDTLNAIAFPTFVADLIKGTFQAIVDATIQQMEAYANLLSNVAKTVDQFMADNISDNNARDYLVASHPGHFFIDSKDEKPRLRVRRNADELSKPDFKAELGTPEDVELDDDATEQVLVPAARRRLAQNRHSMLSTMVMMGIQRIVITSGRISAKMGFRIDASDIGRADTASQFDFKNETTASYGGGLVGWLTGGPKIQTKNTVAYVSSTKKESQDELNVEADLTGAVDLKFKSDYFPMSRLATPEMMAAIQGNTPNPSANTPVQGSIEKGNQAPAQN